MEQLIYRIFATSKESIFIISRFIIAQNILRGSRVLLPSPYTIHSSRKESLLALYPFKYL
jgi:hypothetical protein